MLPQTQGPHEHHFNFHEHRNPQCWSASKSRPSPTPRLSPLALPHLFRNGARQLGRRRSGFRSANDRRGSVLMGDEKSLLGRLDVEGRKILDLEASPGRHKQNERAEISHEADISKDGRNQQGEAEFHPLPDEPELSPKPEKFKD